MVSICFDSGSIPYISAGAAALADANDVKFEAVKTGLVDASPELKDATGNTLLRGDIVIAKYLLHNHSMTSTPASALDAAEIQQWLEFANVSLRDVANLDQWATYLDGCLQMRTYIVGYKPTIADLALWGTLRISSRWAGMCRNYLKKGDGLHNLMRWYQHIDTDPKLRQGVEQINKAGGVKKDKAAAVKAGEKRQKVKTSGGFVDLEDAEQGKVVTRFPPEPSGFLHIGHTKAAMLNHYFARKYDGIMLLRFDDTNPSKEKEEFVENILIDLDTLGIKPDKMSHTSDHFPLMLDMCTKMIKEGKAYVDSTPVEELREMRMARKESPFRSKTIEENLMLWEEMQKGSELGLKSCVRAKIDMAANNACMRDPIIYRCNLVPHLRTGTKYKVYPTYDFACPIVDSIEGVTHALRTTEYNMRNEQYDWMIKALGLRSVHIWDFSRLNFVHTLLSKRKLQWFVDSNLVDGWDDPRFPTVQGMMRRGLTKEGLLQFIIGQGGSKNVNLMEWGKLWQTNRKIIDEGAARHTAVVAKDVVNLTISDGPAEVEYRVVPRHKKNESLGNKSVAYSSKLLIEGADAARMQVGEEFTLMNWGNAIVDKLGDTIETHLHLEGDFRKTEKKITWLSSEDVVPVKLVSFDYLITKPKLEEEDNFEDYINPTSRIEVDAIADSGIRLVKKGQIIQFERRGFFICDSPYIRKGSDVVFYEIPDGHDKGPSKLTEATGSTVTQAAVEAKMAKKEKLNAQRKEKELKEEKEGSPCC